MFPFFLSVQLSLVVFLEFRIDLYILFPDAYSFFYIVEVKVELESLKDILSQHYLPSSLSFLNLLDS